MSNPYLRSLVLLGLVALTPILGGPAGGACQAAFSQSPAPDLEGRWDISYDDTLGVEVSIGGATYTAEIGAQGGGFTIDHEGQPITFDLNCAHEAIICPSEVFPASVRIEQRSEIYPHRMFAMLPTQECLGQEVEPDPAECGTGTQNPDCDVVCDGDIVVVEEERFGVIDEEGESFELYLGAGIATNGINCALIGGSLATAELDTIGDAESDDWEAIAMTDGVISTTYAGGCLWADDVGGDDELEALVIGASITFTTGFQGTRR